MTKRKKGKIKLIETCPNIYVVNILVVKDVGSEVNFSFQKVLTFIFKLEYLLISITFNEIRQRP